MYYFLSSERVNTLLCVMKILHTTDKNDIKNYQQLSRWLEEQETKYQIIVYVTDPTPTQWTRRCIRQSDEIFLVADTHTKNPPSVS